MCYFFFVLGGVIFLLIEKQSKFVRFHAWQSLLYPIEMIILYIAVIVGSYFYSLVGYLLYVLWIFRVIMSIAILVSIIQGKMYKVPIAGQIAGSLAK